jgi:leader peptidase (prepilin peptidase) / N-methyltransferase
MDQFWRSFVGGEALGDMLSGAYLAGVLAAIAWIDGRRQIIPDWLNGLLAAGGGVAVMVLGRPSLMDAIAGAAIGASAFWALRITYHRLRRRSGLGLGDVKFAGAAGIWVGASGLPWMLLVASVSGLLWAIAAGFVRGGVDGQTRVSFGPHLALGALAAWMAAALGLW